VLVVSVSGEAFEFLSTLDGDFNTDTPDAKVLWAVQVVFDAPGAIEGSVFPSTLGSATAWVCSSETYRRLKGAHPF
jgi:hypothetical protein